MFFLVSLLSLIMKTFTDSHSLTGGACSLPICTLPHNLRVYSSTLCRNNQGRYSLAKSSSANDAKSPTVTGSRYPYACLEPMRHPQARVFSRKPFLTSDETAFQKTGFRFWKKVWVHMHMHVRVQTLQLIIYIGINVDLVVWNINITSGRWRRRRIKKRRNMASKVGQ